MEKKSFQSLFWYGAKRLMPIAPGILPFGLIMGAVASSAGLSTFETMGMNILVFAGASQLAAIELMNKNTPTFIVVLTGVIINLRFIMYSTSFAPLVTKYDPLRKLGLAYLLTDQSFAVTINEFEHLNGKREKVIFYFGAAAITAIIWNCSVLMGSLFGNIAPEELSLDFIIPLAFMSLVVPSLRNKKLCIVALVSFIASLIFHSLPFNLGLVASALCGISVGYYLDGRESHG